jgi:hypothetical protein
MCISFPIIIGPIYYEVHITSIVKFLNEIIQLNGANCPKYWQGPFVPAYMSSISHNNDVKTNFENKFIFRFKNSP